MQNFFLSELTDHSYTFIHKHTDTVCVYTVLSMVLKHIKRTRNELVLVAHETWGCGGTWAWARTTFCAHDLGLVTNSLVPQSPHQRPGT